MKSPTFAPQTSNMEILKISAVSYLNTFPFVFGLKESGLLQNFELELDVPSVCAEKFKKGMVDIALVPVGALPEIGEFSYISDYCIGAVAEVKTVLLLSKVPLEQIRQIYLDFDSRTSVELVKVLAGKHWDIHPQWTNLAAYQLSSMQELESVVAIGDKTLGIRSKFPYVYDLARAWINFSGLPFVFAVWVSRKTLPHQVLHQFTRALAYGIGHKIECLEYFSDKLPECDDCLSYLETNISYQFDAKKKEGLKLFLATMAGLKTS